MKLFSILSKHRKTISVILILFLICSICTLFNFSAITETNTVGEISKEQFNNSSFFGYTVTNTNDGVEFVPNDLDPQVWVLLSESPSFNQIVIGFTNELSTDSDIKVYYAVEGESFSEDNSSVGALLVDRKTAVINVKSGAFTTLRFDIDAPFSISYIKLNCLELIEITKQVSLTALILLSVAIILASLLAIFEKKIGYFKWIKSKAVSIYASTKQLLTKKTVAKFVIRVLFLLTSSLLIISYILILMLASMSLAIIVYMFLLSALTVIFFIADRVLANNMNAPLMFLVITLVIGFMIAALLPITVSNNWDEEYHYARCVDVKNLFFSSEKSDADIFQEQRKFVLSTEAYLKSPQEMIASLLVKDSFKHYQPPRMMNYYQLIGHAPGAFAMIFADIVNLNYFSTFIIAKMFNVTVYALIIFLGMRKLKSGGLIFASICMMPTALFLASTYSYDYFITAFMAYAYAYFISELQTPDKLLTKKDIVLMLGAVLLACMPKAIYCVLLIPMLFMPKEKFKSTKQRKKFHALGLFVIAASAVSFILPMLLNMNSASDLRGGADVSASGQILFILKNPFEYLKILLKFLGFYVSFTNATALATSYAYVGSASGIYGTLAICIMAFAAFTDKSEHDDFSHVLRIKSAALLTSFVQVALVATALYISFTPVGHTGINGCQWRYIIPILIPTLYCVGSSKISHTIDKRFLYSLVYGALALNAFASFYDVYIKNIFMSA